MNSALKYILFLSLISVGFLELGFFLEGFLQTCLFSIVAIIYFLLIFLFYGYIKDKSNQHKNKKLFVFLMVLPLISMFFNPTKFLHTADEDEVVLRGTNFSKIALIQNTTTLSLLSDSTFRLKEFGFWMNTTKDGEYYIRNKMIVLKYNDQFIKYKLKKHYEIYRLYRLKGKKKLDYSNYYELDKIGDTFIEQLRPIKKKSS
jgi:hypothetical protein